MSLRAVQMWTVDCDRCGKDAAASSDYAAWGQCADAIEQAEYGEWLIRGDKHYCPDCVEWSADEDELIPKATP